MYRLATGRLAPPLFLCLFAVLSVALAKAESHPTPGKLMTQEEVLKALLKRYRSLRTQIQSLAGGRKASTTRVSEITKTLAKTLADYKRNQRAVQSVLNAAKGRKTVAQRMLLAPPPQRPRLQYLPSRPNPSFYGSAFEYDLAVRSWEAECERIRQTNALLVQQYQADLRRHAAMREQAAVELRAANAKIAECEKALTDLLSARKSSERPLMTERQKLTETTRASQAQARTLVSRLEEIVSTLRDTPEETRLKYGVLEWKKEFYSLAEIEALYAALLREIKGVPAHTEPQAITDELAGVKKPRYPKQDEADALKALIDRAKTAGASSN